MRLAVIALSLTTAAFAASTVYLAVELQTERATAAAPASAIAAAPPALTSPPANTAAFARNAEPATRLSATLERADSPAMNTVVTNNTGMPAELLAQMNAQQHKHNQELVQRFDDPVQRAELLAEFKAMTRSSNKGLAQVLKLSNEDAERLIDLLTLQQVETQVSYARCSLDGPCDVAKIAQFDTDSATREIDALLGADGQQKLEQFRNSSPERESIAQFRGRLADAAYLHEDMAESLIEVLADERMRISVEASKNGSGLSGFGNGTGMIYVSETADASPEGRYASAQENSRRFRVRAAEVLTAPQLRAFEEMQEELLLSMRQQLRYRQEFSAVMINSTN